MIDSRGVVVTCGNLYRPLPPCVHLGCYGAYSTETILYLYLIICRMPASWRRCALSYLSREGANPVHALTERFNLTS